MVSSARGATSRWALVLRYDIWLLSIGGVLYARFSPSFFDVSRRRIAGPGSAEPAGQQLRPGSTRSTMRWDALPDPKHLCAEERAAAMSHTAKLQNRLAAYLTFLAGAADTAGDPVLGCRTTGSLVAIATNNPVVVGRGS